MVLNRLLFSLLSTVMVLVACGGSSQPAPAPSPTQTLPTATAVGPTVPPSTKPLAEPSADSGPSENEYASGEKPPATRESIQLGEVQHDIMPTRDHVSEGTPVEYSTIPPTSGNHWPQWSQCGFFEEELPDERIVHNLEHGNIVVSYNLPDQSSVYELRAALNEIDGSSEWAVTRAYSKIPEGTVALAAWGVSDTMQGVQPDRIRGFFDKYAGELAPERIPCDKSGVMPRSNSLPRQRIELTGHPIIAKASGF